MHFLHHIPHTPFFVDFGSSHSLPDNLSLLCAQELASPVHAHTLNIRRMANMMWAFARMGHHPGSAWMDAILARMLPMLCDAS